MIRELDAVNSEFITNAESDSDRLDRIFQILAGDRHDYGKFVAGSRKSLGGGELKSTLLREELIQFHQKWYSANTMCLCILGKQTISQLIEMVERKFSAIANKNIVIPNWPVHPYDELALMKFVHVVPVMDLRSITLRFAYPDDVKHYKCDVSFILDLIFLKFDLIDYLFYLAIRLSVSSDQP